MCVDDVNVRPNPHANTSDANRVRKGPIGPHARIAKSPCLSATLKARSYSLNDVLLLNSVVFSSNFDITQPKPLLDAVFNNEADGIIWNRVYNAVTKSTPPPSRLPFLPFNKPHGYAT